MSLKIFLEQSLNVHYQEPSGLFFGEFSESYKKYKLLKIPERLIKIISQCIIGEVLGVYLKKKCILFKCKKTLKVLWSMFYQSFFFGYVKNYDRGFFKCWNLAGFLENICQKIVLIYLRNY